MTEQEALQPPIRPLAIALAALFVTFGVVSASWVTRIPQIRNLLHASASLIGLLFLAGAVGAMSALLIAPKAIRTLGTRKTAIFGSCLVVTGAGINIIALGTLSPILVACGNLVTGMGYGFADVAINVESAEAEKKFGQSLLPRLHAGYSLGTLCGAILGVALMSLNVDIWIQLIAVNVLFISALVYALRYMPRQVVMPREATPRNEANPRESQWSNWRNRRLILLGVIIFSGSVVEGGANDWLPLTMVDDYHVTPTIAAMTFAVLLSAMTITRFFGGKVVDSIGRARSIATLGVLGLVGVLFVILGAGLPALAWIGVAAWGAGVALVFPLCISAAAEGENSSGRVAVVTAFGYGAFLVAPPLLGMLAQATSLTTMFWVFAGLLAVMIASSGAAKPTISAKEEKESEYTPIR